MTDEEIKIKASLLVAEAAKLLDGAATLCGGLSDMKPVSKRLITIGIEQSAMFTNNVLARLLPGS